LPSIASGKDGFIAAAVTAGRARELAQWVDSLVHDYGYQRIQRIDRSELPRWIASPRYQGAAYGRGQRTICIR